MGKKKIEILGAEVNRELAILGYEFKREKHNYWRVVVYFYSENIKLIKGKIADFCNNKHIWGSEPNEYYSIREKKIADWSGKNNYKFSAEMDDCSAIPRFLEQFRKEIGYKEWE